MKRSFFQAAVTSILLYGCTTWTLTKRLEKKLDGNYTRMLRAILNKSWQQHPTRHQLYGHLPPITKTIKVRRTRHAGHCWRSRDELIRDVLLWIPTHGRAKAGRPARTYIQQLCEDTGCCPEDLPRAMNDREEWRERVRDIRAASTIWWWWWKPDRHCWLISKIQSGRDDTLEERYARKFCFKLGKLQLLRPRDEETEFPVEACWLSQTQEDQSEQIHPQTFDDPFFDTLAWSTCTGFPLDIVNKEYYVEVSREIKKRFRRKWPALFKSGQWHFHKDNALVYNSFLVTDYVTKMDIKTVPQPPYSQYLAPCDFLLFPKLKENLRGGRYETTEEMKKAAMKIIDTLTQEDFHGAFQKLLERYKSLKPEEITSKGNKVLFVYYQ